MAPRFAAHAVTRQQWEKSFERRRVARTQSYTPATSSALAALHELAPPAPPRLLQESSPTILALRTVVDVGNLVVVAVLIEVVLSRAAELVVVEDGELRESDTHHHTAITAAARNEVADAAARSPYEHLVESIAGSPDGPLVVLAARLLVLAFQVVVGVTEVLAYYDA